MVSFSPTAVPATDFRVDYLDQARECLRANNQIMDKFPKDWAQQPEFWANLLGAISNATVATVSEDVALGALTREWNRRKENERLRKMLDEFCQTTDE